MNELQLITTEQFNAVPLNVYGKEKMFYMTREQAGQALEYANPRIAISKIHERHKDRLDEFSTVVTLGTVEGGRMVERDTIVYTLKGVMELCRHSHQPKADAFMDFTWDIMERLLKGEIIQHTAAPFDFLEACGVIPPALPVLSDEDVAARFVEVIGAALLSGEYYLLPDIRKSTGYEKGVLLGRYNEAVLTLISPLAHEIYNKAVQPQTSIRKLRARLVAAGLMCPATKNDTYASFKGTRHGAMRISLQAVNALQGRSLPLLAANS